MSNFPMPGSPVRGSKTGKPIMALFDLLGRNWSMGVLWILCTVGPLTFRGLQEQCEGISPTVLNMRLKEMRQADFITHTSDGYVVTAMGLELFAFLEPLGYWSLEWAEHLEKLNKELKEA
ncbi:MAG: helix-turn-helix transcriptional regulator [Cohaesibacteraceae bacterium]|nr:helix-turn-helix transcriptional regulator [Cohaesibacteraceae bacterium]